MGKGERPGKDFQHIYDNVEKLSSSDRDAKIDAAEKEIYGRLTEALTLSGISPEEVIYKNLHERLKSLCDYFLKHYAKADLLACSYQKCYRAASFTVYILAALAVMAVSAQYIFHLSHILIGLEIAAMVIILAIIFIGNYIGLHRRWLDYRLLAERLRFGILKAFLAEAPPVSMKKTDLHCDFIEQVWSVCLYKDLWDKRPELAPLEKEAFTVLKNFFMKAWLEDQQNYHHNKSRTQHKKHHRISWAGEVFYFLTLIAAVFHFLGTGGEQFSKYLTFLAITLPVIGAACSALRSHFDYKKVATSSEMTVRQLDFLMKRMDVIQSLEELRVIVRDAELLMLQENAEWHVTFEVDGGLKVP